MSSVMKIKVAILENDHNYLNRIVSVFSTRYADKLEVYSFTNLESALAALESARINVFVASDAFEIDMKKLPKNCGFGYLADSAETGEINGELAIAKYQKVEQIYKQILSLTEDGPFPPPPGQVRLIAFQSIGGGCGGSTVAAACALHFAANGKRTLYLNLEKFGSSDSFFTAEGPFDMSDIIFALKSKKPLMNKLESCVKQDPRGVCFFSQSKVALDMLELTTDDMLRLIRELERTGSYDMIVVDLDFSIEADMLKILRETQAVVWVTDGSEISNTKLSRAFEALSIREQNADYPLTNRLSLIYNKFSNKTSTRLQNLEIPEIGGSPRFEHATTAMVLGQLAPKDMFDKV